MSPSGITSGSPEAPKDSAKAVEWFKRLAEKGDRRGENALGVAYRHGYGVAEDDAVGFEWFYKAALKG
jgi:TPR repeat protein